MIWELYWHPWLQSRFDRTYFGALTAWSLLDDSLDHLIFTIIALDSLTEAKNRSSVFHLEGWSPGMFSPKTRFQPPSPLQKKTFFESNDNARGECPLFITYGGGGIKIASYECQYSRYGSDHPLMYMFRMLILVHTSHEHVCMPYENAQANVLITYACKFSCVGYFVMIAATSAYDSPSSSAMALGMGN